MRNTLALITAVTLLATTVPRETRADEQSCEKDIRARILRIMVALRGGVETCEKAEHVRGLVTEPPDGCTGERGYEVFAQTSIINREDKKAVGKKLKDCGGKTKKEPAPKPEIVPEGEVKQCVKEIDERVAKLFDIIGYGDGHDCEKVKNLAARIKPKTWRTPQECQKVDPKTVLLSLGELSYARTAAMKAVQQCKNR